MMSFFFSSRRRHTRFDCDWSSDVCSSDLLPLLAKTLVAIAAFAGLRQGELCGLDWTDYAGSELAINRSIWMSVVNLPKTRASRDTVSVIPALAEILDEYRRSMGNPKAGMIFHSGNR